MPCSLCTESIRGSRILFFKFETSLGLCILIEFLLTGSKGSLVFEGYCARLVSTIQPLLRDHNDLDAMYSKYYVTDSR